MTHPNLATALAAFQSEMPVVPKSKRATVPTKSGGQYSYTYADLAGVTEVAMAPLTKHGLSFSCSPRYTAQGYELRGVLMHTSGEKLQGSLPIRGNTPQEIGSSLTYMRRYLFGCLTGVVTEDDDDAAAASKTLRKAAEPTDEPPQAPASTRTMSRPQRPAGDGVEGITKAQSAALHAAFKGTGIDDREVRLAYCRMVIGRDITTSNELTKAEASKTLEALRQDAEATPPEEQP